MQDLKSTAKTVGIKQSTKVVAEGSARAAIVAKDADDKIRSPFLTLCTSHNVPITYVDTMRELGDACGVDVPTAVVALL